MGNSFYGSRLGSSFRCSVEVWFCGTGFYGYMVCGFLGKSSMITTTTTSTTTATATTTTERLFEALRVIPSTDRGQVVIRFRKGAEKVLSMGDLQVSSDQRGISDRGLYRSGA